MIVASAKRPMPEPNVKSKGKKLNFPALPVTVITNFKPYAFVKTLHEVSFFSNLSENLKLNPEAELFCL